MTTVAPFTIFSTYYYYRFLRVCWYIDILNCVDRIIHDCVSTSMTTQHINNIPTIIGVLPNSNNKSICLFIDKVF